MYKDELARKEKEAEKEALKSDKSDLNNLIVNDDTSNSQVDAEINDQMSMGSKQSHN